MGVADDLADALARDTIAAMEETGEDRLFERVGRVLGETSPTMQETFLTSIRVRMAERRARRFLDATLKARREGRDAPAGPRDVGSGH
jgi:hypothetical protein